MYMMAFKVLGTRVRGKIKIQVFDRVCDTRYYIPGWMVEETRKGMRPVEITNECWGVGDGRVFSLTLSRDYNTLVVFKNKRSSMNDDDQQRGINELQALID